MMTPNSIAIILHFSLQHFFFFILLSTNVKPTAIAEHSKKLYLCSIFIKSPLNYFIANLSSAPAVVAAKLTTWFTQVTTYDYFIFSDLNDWILWTRVGTYFS